MELSQSASGALTQRFCKRFDFYKNREKTTREFETFVANLREGAIVVMSIADTAFAKSRPATDAFYKALTSLGAPAGKGEGGQRSITDMDPVEYRRAWARVCCELRPAAWPMRVRVRVASYASSRGGALSRRAFAASRRAFVAIPLRAAAPIAIRGRGLPCAW